MTDLPTALPLTPDICDNTANCRLVLEFSPRDLKALIVSLDAEVRPIYAMIPLPGQDGGEQPSAIEEIVYANPLLLCDFKSTDIILRQAGAMLLPDGFTPWPEPMADECLVDESIAEGQIIASATCSDNLLKFLRRSFANPPIHIHTALLCRHWQRISRRSNRSRLYVQYFDGSLDVALYCRGSLLFASTFNAPDCNTALYYVLAVCRSYDFDVETGELLLHTSTEARDQMQPVLRRYINYVMPYIVPAEFYRNAPLELSLTALKCV